MKIADIVVKNDTELGVVLADSRKQLAQLVLDSRTKQAANIKQIHAVKKTVARVLTVQRQRQLEVAAVAVPAADVAGEAEPAVDAINQDAPNAKEKSNG